MDSEQKRISYFVSFCVEQYKNAKHLTGSQAFEELNQYGVLDYLVENYEILHTQSYQWILEDIDEFINIRKQRIIAQDNLYLLLPSKVSWLAEMLSEDTGVGIVEAICRIYRSEMYKRLEIEETKLWHEGPVALYEEINEATAKPLP